MAPKASTSNNTPSAILADAVNAFTKAASLAFAAVEEEAKIEVARAQAEVADMRREHSKNMKFMNKTQLQEKDWERQGEMLKTSLEKSELTIKHQAETIVQLRDEVMQWKSQLETARRELQDWKDQYLRTEQERSRLSSRVDELMAEQLQNATQQTARASTWFPEPIEPPTRKQPSNTSRKPRPSMPNVPSDDDEEPMPPPRKVKSKPSAAQNGTDRERTYVEHQPPAKETTRDAPVARPKKRPSAVVPRAPPTPRASAPRNEYPDYQAPSPPRPQFIRRVHAIVEVPVKEEMNSDEENALASDDSEWQPSKKAENLRRRRSSVKSKPYVEIDEEDEDEDDQLLIGAEEDPNEIYGTRRVLPEDIRPTPKSLAKNTSGSNKKRKLDADSGNGGRSVAKVGRKK